MKAGAWDYAVKPVREKVLTAKLEETLERARNSFDISLAVAESTAGKTPNLRGVKFGPYTPKEAIALGSYALVAKAEDESGDERHGPAAEQRTSRFLRLDEFHVVSFMRWVRNGESPCRG